MEKIYVDSDDEITNVIERLKSAKGKDIAVIVPKGAILLQSIINLKLLKKQGDVLKKKVYLITADKLGRNLGAKAGLVVKRKFGLGASTENDKVEEESVEDVQEDVEEPEETEETESAVEEEDDDQIEEDINDEGTIEDDSEDEDDLTLEDVLNEEAEEDEEEQKKDSEKAKQEEKKEQVPSKTVENDQDDGKAGKSKLSQGKKTKAGGKRIKASPVSNAVIPGGGPIPPRVLDLGKNKKKSDREFGALKLDGEENIVRVDAITKKRGRKQKKVVSEIGPKVQAAPTSSLPNSKKGTNSTGVKAVLDIDDLREELGMYGAVKSNNEKVLKNGNKKTSKKGKPDEYDLFGKNDKKEANIDSEEDGKKSQIPSEEKKVDFSSLSGNILKRKKVAPSKKKSFLKSGAMKKKKGHMFESKKLNNNRIKKKMKKSRNKTEVLPKKIFAIFGTFILVIVLVSLVAGYILVPKADIVVSAAPQDIKESLNLEATLDEAKLDSSDHKVLKGEVLEGSKDIVINQAVSGEIEKQNKATGTITVYNEYSSASQTLIETTRFESPEGFIFKTTKKVVVPGATLDAGSTVPGKIDVPVVAENPGDNYNIQATTFKIPGFQGSDKYNGFYGKSSGAMSGGESGTQKATTEADVTQATQALNGEIETYVKSLMGADIVYLEDVATVSYDQSLLPKEGEAMDSIEVTIPVTVSAIVFKESDLFEALKAEFGEDHGWGDELQSESMTYEFFEAEKVDGQNIRFLVSFEGESAPEIELPSDIENQLKGKKKFEAEKILKEIDGVSDVDITLNPSWFNSLPLMDKNIDVRILEVEKDESNEDVENDSSNQEEESIEEESDEPEAEAE